MPFLLVVNPLVVFNWLVFTAIATQRAVTGQLFSYPMTIRRPCRAQRAKHARSA
jgi:uncharacterized Tic20 family protein